MKAPFPAQSTAGTWRVAKPTEKPAKPDVVGIFEEGTDTLPVRMVLFQDGIRTGWDEGALGFEEGAVWFSGRATSFRIVRADAIPPHDDGRSDHTMNLRHPRRRVSVEFRTVPCEARSEWRDSREIAARLRRFWREDRGEGESQYPPLAPRPGILLSLRRKRSEALCVGAGLFVAAILTLRHPSLQTIVQLPWVAISFMFWRLELRHRRSLDLIAQEEA